MPPPHPASEPTTGIRKTDSSHRTVFSKICDLVGLSSYFQQKYLFKLSEAHLHIPEITEKPVQRVPLSRRCCPTRRCHKWTVRQGRDAEDTQHGPARHMGLASTPPPGQQTEDSGWRQRPQRRERLWSDTRWGPDPVRLLLGWVGGLGASISPSKKQWRGFAQPQRGLAGREAGTGAERPLSGSTALSLVLPAMPEGRVCECVCFLA